MNPVGLQEPIFPLMVGHPNGRITLFKIISLSSTSKFAVEVLEILFAVDGAEEVEPIREHV